MINLAAFNKQSINTFFCILISTIVLQGCGGQRDEPFNPSTSSTGAGATVESRLILSEDKVKMPRLDGKHYLVINTDKELTDVWDAYTDTQLDKTLADMSVGRAILYDAGEIGNCPQKLSYKGPVANETSVNSVTIYFKFDDADKASSAASSNSSLSSKSSNSSSSSNSSACVSTKPSRPFYIYYVHSRKELLYGELVNGAIVK